MPFNPGYYCVMRCHTRAHTCLCVHLVQLLWCYVEKTQNFIIWFSLSSWQTKAEWFHTKMGWNCEVSQHEVKELSGSSTVSFKKTILGWWMCTSGARKARKQCPAQPSKRSIRFPRFRIVVSAHQGAITLCCFKTGAVLPAGVTWASIKLQEVTKETTRG